MNQPAIKIDQPAGKAPDRLLFAMRKVTLYLRHIPGAIVILEPIRSHFLTYKRKLVISDFCGNGKLSVALNEHMGSQIFWYGSYSRDVLLVLDRILTTGSTLFDVGANQGEISISSALRIGRQGSVHAFEPMPDNIEKLRHNVNLNQLNNVVVVPRGLSNCEGAVRFFEDATPFHDGSRNEGLATRYLVPGRDREIGSFPVTTLDKYCSDKNLQKVDVIKIDVEGSEFDVLKGGLNVLGRDTPWLILEIALDTCHAAGHEPREILEFLSAFGYTFREIGRKGRLTLLDHSNLGIFQNVLCVPANGRVDS